MGDLDPKLISRLKREEKAAQDQLEGCHQRFKETLSDIGYIPQPDGTLRIYHAGAEVRRSTRQSAEATKRLMDYIVHGRVPEGYSPEQDS